MNEIKDILKSNGYSQKDIDKFLTHYEYAVNHDLPYPLFYAMAKLTI